MSALFRLSFVCGKEAATFLHTEKCHSDMQFSEFSVRTNVPHIVDSLVSKQLLA